VIVTEIKLRIAYPTAPRVTVVTTLLSYDPSDPYAVEITFNAGYSTHSLTSSDEPNTWRFARDLLAGGGAETDIAVCWHNHSVMFHLADGCHRADLSTYTVGDLERIKSFVQAVYARIPAGRELTDADLDRALSESIEADLDRVLAEILGDAT
jgi:hypothetical protein